ncbi:oligopeptide ABC transporter substrate-binding protein [Paenibacillus alkalitolerans]|uniref:oligopeptide ABC transporter substrate-binding protein n=1 Tax=Paenibacillus alkalitolerans TaxID=2799335 RepID=UPI0018F37FA7|nr:oligopeptide ABC transporter substrate-binding protein [Paenibacillus alkalitolerans]
MKKHLLIVLSIVFALSFVLAACSDNSSDGAAEDQDQPSPEQTNDQAQDQPNDQPADGPKEGGVVTYAVDTAPEGFLEPGFYGSAVDAELLSFLTEGMFKTEDDLKTAPNLATWEESEDHKVYTFHIKEGVKWHNGDELTAEDWAYALEVLGHPDYSGPRYDNVKDILGIDEYHSGKADHIEGVKVVDPYTLQITFKEVKINNLDNLWSFPMPKKYYEGISVKDLPNSDKVRTKAIGLGAFKLKNIVPGESVEFERYDDYWQGKPLLDGVIVKVIDPSLISGMMQNGEVDAMGIRPADVEGLKSASNVQVIEQQGLSYSYIGIDFGHYDKEKGTGVMDNPKFQDKKLRQAMLYAIDRQSLINAYLQGFANVANSPIPSVFWTRAPESELNPYEYNSEKAKELLAEAGYKDTDGDGFVEDKDGKPFKINFGHYAGPAAFEGRAQGIIQNLRDVGLDVQLMTGALVEFNTYNDMKDNDDPQLELFFGAWGTGSDPDPTGLWGSKSQWNYGRWVNEESDRLLAEALSEKAFDENYRRETYIQWQKLFNEELPALPLWENMDLYAVNKRIQGIHVNSASLLNDVHKWWVTE